MTRGSTPGSAESAARAADPLGEIFSGSLVSRNMKVGTPRSNEARSQLDTKWRIMAKARLREVCHFLPLISYVPDADHYRDRRSSESDPTTHH